MLEKGDTSNAFGHLYTINKRNIGPEITKEKNWWKNRTKLEKWLLLFLFFLSGLMILAILIFYNGISLSDLIANTSQQPICVTPGCVRAAARILDYMDPKASPCDDFYEYACGNWINKKQINEDQTGITQFGTLRDELNKKLKVLVDSPGNQSEADYFKMMRIMYKQCMNLTQIDQQSEGEIIKDIVYLGGWPLIEGPLWRSEKFNWIDSLKKMRDLGYSHNIFLTISVSADIRNNTRHIIDIDELQHGGPNRKFLLKGINDTVVKAYFQAMIDSATFIGKNSKQAIETGAREILDFEIKLAKTSTPAELRRNFTELYHKMKLADLAKLSPSIPWADVVRHVVNSNLSDDEEINVKNPKYVTKLEQIINETDSRVIANYMIWRIVFASLPDSEEKLRKIYEAYDRTTSGKKSESPRSDTCISRLFSGFHVPLSALYVQNSFDEESRQRAKEMVEYIRNQFIETLEQVDWMDDDTKSRAIEKAEQMNVQIGYPPELLDTQKVMQIYEGLIIREDDKYFRNNLAVRKHYIDNRMKELEKPIDRNDWRKFAEAATVNAFNSYLQNTIRFPAGVLQGVFFNKDRPNYLNYAAIGYVIGHEITHGFDDKGRQFDKDGNNRNWWHSDTEKNFKDKVQCIIDQYGNYTVAEINENLNGIHTQGENIADNGGLKQAYYAYMDFVNDFGSEPLLPGLNLNQEQLFWVSVGNIWCSKLRPERLRLQVNTGHHCPPSFRVNGPLSNMAEFSKSFDCPLGSKMNPIKKCSVW